MCPKLRERRLVDWRLKNWIPLFLFLILLLFGLKKPLVVEQLQKILFFARAAAGNDGDIHPGGHRVQHFKVEVFSWTITAAAEIIYFIRIYRQATVDLTAA